MKVGDYVLCIKEVNIIDIIVNSVGQWYEINEIHNYTIVVDYMDFSIGKSYNSIGKFNDYFITKKESRLMKLDKLENDEIYN